LAVIVYCLQLHVLWCFTNKFYASGCIVYT